MLKKRYGSVALLLHSLAPGLGFLYAEKIGLALFVPLLMLLWIFSLGWFRVLLEPWGIALLWSGLLLIYIGLMPIAFLFARRSPVKAMGRKRDFIRHTTFAVLLLLLFAAVLHYRATLFGYETFRLPSRSMENTLLPNDYIIVDTWVYQDREPRAGDIVVFQHPDTQRLFTKRIIALPGETVSIIDGKVSVNGEIREEPYVHISNNQRSASFAYTEQRVPAGHYFMLGDNRDNSNDSRSWGFVSAASIYGRVVSVWFSFSPEEGIRRERIKHVL